MGRWTADSDYDYDAEVEGLTHIMDRPLNMPCRCRRCGADMIAKDSATWNVPLCPMCYRDAIQSQAQKAEQEQRAKNEAIYIGAMRQRLRD